MKATSSMVQPLAHLPSRRGRDPGGENGNRTAGSRPGRLDRLAVAISVVLVAPLAWMPLARAGGSWLELDREVYRPGERAVATGTASRGQLGWVDDGPFHAYLGDTLTVPGTGPIPLGQLVVGDLVGGGISVTLEFVVPEVPPGDYAILYCNDPCTEGLGDLIGGEITIGAAALPFTGLETDALLVAGASLVVVGLVLGVQPWRRSTTGRAPDR